MPSQAPQPSRGASRGRIIVVIIALIGGVAIAAAIDLMMDQWSTHRERKAAVARQLAEERTKLTANSKRDATQPIVDESYQFRINPPTGWMTLTGQEMSLISLDALGGMMPAGKTSAAMMVFCEHRPNTDVRRFVSRMTTYVSLDMPEGVEPKIEPTTSQELPAARLTARGTLIGQPTEMLALAVERGEHVCSVLSYSMSGDSSAVTDLEQAINAVDWLEGPMVVRPPRTTEMQGVGWRVRAGVLDSPATGLRLRANKWCRLAGGVFAHGLNSRIEATLSCTKPSLMISVTPWQQPNVDRVWLEHIANSALDGYDKTDERLEIAIRGTTLPLRVGRADDGDELLSGALDLGDGLVAELLVSYAPSLRKDVVPELDGLLAGIERLDEGTRASLRAELATHQPHTDISLTGAYRNGQYADYRYGLQWAPPKDGTWRVRIGDAAAHTTEGAHLWAIEPSIDLELALYVVPSPPGEFHAASIAELKSYALTAPSRQPPLSWLQADAEVSLISDPAELRNDMLIATVVVDDVGIRAVANVPVGFGTEGQQRARAALAKLQLVPKKAITSLQTKGGLRDHRNGYQMWIPPDLSEISRVPLTIGGTVQWGDGDRQVAIVTIAFGEKDNEMAKNITLQRGVSFMAKAATGPIERSTSTLGGVPAKRVLIPLRQHTAEVRQIDHLGVMHVLIVGLPEDERKRVFESFQLP